MTIITIDLNDSPRQLRCVAELILNYVGDDRQQELRYTPQEPLITVAGWARSEEVPGALVPAAPASTAAASDELDAHGYPWDDRIHASSKAKNADGTWRQRRNLDPAIRETVEGELKDRGYGKAAPVPVVPPVEAAPVPPAPPTPPAPPVEAAPVPPAPPTPPAGLPTITFPELMTRITTAVSNNTLSMSDIPAILTSTGVSGGLPGLAATPELIPLVAAALGVSSNG
jgi:hypothetical protein